MEQSYNSNIPAAAGTQVGASLTSGAANTYGSWTLVHTYSNWWPAHRVVIQMNALETSGGVISATTLNVYLDLGIGTSAASVTPIAEKLAGSQSQGLGTIYDLPCYVRAGAVNVNLYGRIQCTQANAVMGVRATFSAMRRNPEMGNFAYYIEPLGAGASTTGTAVTPGVSTNGAWAQIVASTTRRYMGLLASPLFNVDTTMTSGLANSVDIGIGTAGSERIIAAGANYGFIWSTSEQKDNVCVPIWYRVPAGSRLAARVNVSATADSTNSIMLYGICGM